MKTFIWGGLFIGSSIGGVVPWLWGDFGLSMNSVLLSTAGGILGVWAGYQLGKYFGA